ncbi:hypothetical protein [Pseudonocardia sp. T1-2H]|uniref:hypothetical protein n=1 Tax=Pseudonocardia sp. T1-2H TaxID=3128899 RepID=UPI003100E3DC
MTEDAGPGAVAGRAFARVYRVSRREDLADYIAAAFAKSGAQVLYATSPQRAPMYFAVQTAAGERVGVIIYPFRANRIETGNRPKDEHKLQIRYGGQDGWGGSHPVGYDVANVDTTLVLGVSMAAGVFVGLDPQIYDPFPMGISTYFKDGQVAEAVASNGWAVFERHNLPGRRRPDRRSPEGLETFVLFEPRRLLDYVRFERRAADLGLDPALRFTTAVEAGKTVDTAGEMTTSLHGLEAQFDMTSTEILEMISQRNRLTVAVRGGVAEYHLQKVLDADPQVVSATSLDQDGAHDFDVVMQDGRTVRVECKNSSPKRYANGDIKVEVQKTRATQGDPAGRLYRPEQFDVVAACLFAPTGEWRFAYRATADMDKDKEHDDRLAALQRVTEVWKPTLLEAL